MLEEYDRSDTTEPSNTTEPDIWYRDGIRFECQQCGDCCRTHGVVWVNSQDIAKMAYHLGLGYSEFRNTYLRDIEGRLTIGETEKGDCLMLDLETYRCIVYPVRPEQCSSYPFWPRCLASRQVWSRRREKCPGINKGRLWTYEEIQQRMCNY